MSLPDTTNLRPPNVRRRRPSMRIPSLGTSGQRLSGPTPDIKRRVSVSAHTAATKTQRTSKTSQKLVVLPSAPQTRPLVPSDEEELTLDVETHDGVREYKSEAERMNKEQRRQAGYGRLTACCVAESFKMKLLASYLKREHNVGPRIFDEALYAMYYLPLLPGYGPGVNVRSSVPAPVTEGVSYLSEAEENGYQGSYFTQPTERSEEEMRDGYISSNSPVFAREVVRPVVAAFEPSSAPEQTAWPDLLEEEEGGAGAGGGGGGSGEPQSPSALLPANTEAWTDNTTRAAPARRTRQTTGGTFHSTPKIYAEHDYAEVVFFEYGVVVFFGLTESQERDILEDLDNAGIMKRKIKYDDWEVEECHFTHDPHISYPRIYNDFFTLKSRSHLLKISIAHALAQSTLLAQYETKTQRVLSAPSTLSIPQQLAESGGLKLRRHEALKLTGSLFKLRRDINLVSNVLDVPELFWSEASLKDLYDAVREYMEIGPRVQVLNEKLGVASSFLDAIHDHLNNSAMERITWIVIWLIVVAILVELGEVLARLVVHATAGSKGGGNTMVASVRGMMPNMQSSIPTREDMLRTLEHMIVAKDP